MERDISKKTISVIGSGNMGSALISGFAKNIVAEPKQITACDVSEERLAALEKETGVTTTTDIRSAVSASEVVIAALKPSVLLDTLPTLSDSFLEESIFISVAAGVTIADITKYLGSKSCDVVRVMPNTPSLVGYGMAGVYSPSSEAAQLVSKLFSAVGKAVVLQRESDIDAVTGVSGSGPAFVFAFTEALATAAMQQGLGEEVALELAVQTVAGAGQLMLQTSKHPSTLREEVSSPGGTTVQGLRALKERDFDEVVAAAVEAATRKARGA